VPAVGTVTPGPAAGAAKVEPEPSRAPVRYGASGEKIATTVVLGVAAVAAIGVGAGMQLAAAGEGNNVTTDQAGGNASSCLTPGTRCTQLSNATNAEVMDENARNGALIGAGVLAAAALVVWVAWPNSRVIESGPHVVPLVSPGVAGLGFVTAF